MAPFCSSFTELIRSTPLTWFLSFCSRDDRFRWPLLLLLLLLRNEVVIQFVQRIENDWSGIFLVFADFIKFSGSCLFYFKPLWKRYEGFSNILTIWSIYNIQYSLKVISIEKYWFKPLYPVRGPFNKIWHIWGIFSYRILL